MMPKKSGIIYAFVFFSLVIASCGSSPTPETVTVVETRIVEKEVEKEVTRIVEVEKIITLTPVPITPTAETRIIFQDDFDDEDSGWNTTNSENVERFYDEGEFHIKLIQETSAWSSNGELVGLDDFELEVDVTSLGSDVTDLVGVMFRYENADNQYLFFINNDGVFALEQQLNGETDFIVGPSRADAINTGNSINRIRIQSDGPALAAYVNDELVAYIIDSTFRRGDINLFASGSSDQEAIFDNLVVTSID